MCRYPVIAMPTPRMRAVLPLMFTGSLLAWLGIAAIDVTRPKAEPRPPTTVYELNETKVTRHEHA